MNNYQRTDEDMDNEECSICFNEYDPSTKVSKLRCNHVYHNDCIKNGLKHQEHVQCVEIMFLIVKTVMVLEL